MFYKKNLGVLFITLKHHESLPHHLISKLTKELELYRVFDSLTFEDEDSEKFETGINTTGDLSEEQTNKGVHVSSHGRLWLLMCVS